MSQKKQKCRYLVGIDEAGRGPLAGPVVVAILKIDTTPSVLRKIQYLFRDIRDSKKLTCKKRESWFLKMREAKKVGILEYCASSSSAGCIDKMGIVYGIRKALNHSLKKLYLNPAYTRIKLDGSLYAPKKFIYQKTIIRGDETERIIAMASVVAKVHRDRIMLHYARNFPRYGFEQHKGYGTRLHYRSIKKYGICKIHRKSFLYSCKYLKYNVK